MLKRAESKVSLNRVIDSGRVTVKTTFFLRPFLKFVFSFSHNSYRKLDVMLIIDETSSTALSMRSTVDCFSFVLNLLSLVCVHIFDFD